MRADEPDYATARALVDACTQEAGERDYPVAVVVTDVGGHIVASARMDGRNYNLHEVARRKAVTSATYGGPTHAVAEIAASDRVVADTLAALGLIAMPGGFPVMTPDGRLAGGLGIAGGPEYGLDQAIGEAALASVV